VFRSAPSAPRSISCRLRSPDFRKAYPNVDVTLSIRKSPGDRHCACADMISISPSWAARRSTVPMNVHLIGRSSPMSSSHRPGHRLGTKIPPCRWRRLPTKPSLTREPGSGTRGLMEQLFESAGVSSQDRHGHEQQTKTIKQAVIAGTGHWPSSPRIRWQPNSTNDGWRRSMVVGLPRRQAVGFVLARKDKVLLPPAASNAGLPQRQGRAFPCREPMAGSGLTRSSASSRRG